jgi:hypothetical protein
MERSTDRDWSTTVGGFDTLSCQPVMERLIINSETLKTICTSESISVPSESMVGLCQPRVKVLCNFLWCSDCFAYPPLREICNYSHNSLLYFLNKFIIILTISCNLNRNLHSCCCQCCILVCEIVASNIQLSDVAWPNLCTIFIQVRGHPFDL